VSFDYLANLRKLKKNFFEGRAGVLIYEKRSQGVREKNKGWDTLL
jgi:hypothetical protein